MRDIRKTEPGKLGINIDPSSEEEQTPSNSTGSVTSDSRTLAPRNILLPPDNFCVLHGDI
jgi:hypothetical protein